MFKASLRKHGELRTNFKQNRPDNIAEGNSTTTRSRNLRLESDGKF